MARPFPQWMERIGKVGLSLLVLGFLGSPVSFVCR